MPGGRCPPGFLFGLQGRHEGCAKRTCMAPLSERLIGVLSRGCAVLVTLVPLAAAGSLAWFGVGALLGGFALGELKGVAGLVLFTLVVAGSAAFFGGALGVGCALAAEELAPAPVRTAIEGAIGFLGALPAVAFGWYASVLVAPISGDGKGSAVATFVAATAVLSAMVAPTTCALCTRALRRVPDSVRNAAAAAGASRMQTTALVVVPAMQKRIVIALVAALGRAVSEATALMILFAAMGRFDGLSRATVASWILSVATTAPSSFVAEQLALPTLAVLLIAAACAFAVSKEYKDLQWA